MQTVVKSRLSGRLVGKNHVDNLIRNYKSKRWLQNSKQLGRNDSLSASFGIGELSQFIEKARENHADGIKLCFGVYPENYRLKPEYAGLQTIVMVAVKEKQVEGGKIILKDIYFSNNGSPEILAFNYSSLCPPDCSDSPFEGGDNLGILLYEQNNRLMIG